MSEQKQLAEFEVPLKKAWKKWKGAVLAAFVLALAFSRWLPQGVVAAFFAAAIFVLFNLTFHFLRYLKNRVFWRVRHRVVGAFVFVGLIPLLLAAGIVCLAGFLLLGQLSAHYFDTSLRGIEEEVSSINLEVARQLQPPASEADLRTVAFPIVQRHSSQFPVLAFGLIRGKPDGTFEIAGRFDPSGLLKGWGEYPAEKWLGDK